MSTRLHQTFMANLKNKLRDGDVSQADLARKMGVSRQYITNILAGRSEPSLGLIERIAEGLEVSAHELLLPIGEKIPA